jgi:GT2 family glycosyltransferase
VIPSVFVIILNFNGSRWLPACLDTLSQTSYSKFSTVVVDNASTDDSRSIVEKYSQITLLENLQNNGFSVGNNLGIRYALAQQADYVVLLNPDTKVKPSWLSEIISIGEQQPSIGILGAVQLNYEGDELNAWTKTMLQPAQQALLVNPSADAAWVEMEWVEGSCFAIKRKVLQAVGLLDPIYFSFYEEIDYCRRARYQGYRTVLVTQSRFHHYRGGIWKANKEKRLLREYQCDNSQLIYSLTAPDKAAVENILNYGKTFLVKCKEALVALNFNYFFALVYMQLSIWRNIRAIRRKWCSDRLRLTGYDRV